MYNRIHIFGASGSGTSTLGVELSKVLPHVHLDSDNYFWKHKFTVPTDVNDRLHQIKADLTREKQWILSGAVCGWGDELRSLFELVVFLWVPQKLRLERLKAREYERYGDKILPGGAKHEELITFLNWASLYDSAGIEVRSKILHEWWMSELNCPILRLEGDMTTATRVGKVLEHLANNNN